MGNYLHRSLNPLRSRQASDLRNLELAILEQVEQIVGKIDVALVQLIDQHHARSPRLGSNKGCARLSRPCLPKSCPGVSATLTTTAFARSSLRRLEIGSLSQNSERPSFILAH